MHVKPYYFCVLLVDRHLQVFNKLLHSAHVLAQVLGRPLDLTDVIYIGVPKTNVVSDVVVSEESVLREL
jgi:hypothetical protein